MLYLWKESECPDKHVAQYEWGVSPDCFLLRRGIVLNAKDFSQCDCYMRSSTLDLPDDPFIRMHLRLVNHAAYIFTPDELFYFNCVVAEKIKISAENLKKLKAALSLTEEDVDKGARALSDQELAIIYSFKECPKFSRIPILRSKVSKSEIQNKYDCIPNDHNLLVVNQKVIDILSELESDAVQFFDAEIHCKDGVLTEYKLLNFTHKIIGIDHEKSIPATFGFKYISYKPGCMRNYKLARDEECLGNRLVTEEVKHVFEQKKIRGARFIRPEDFYGRRG